MGKQSVLAELTWRASQVDAAEERDGELARVAVVR